MSDQQQVEASQDTTKEASISEKFYPSEDKKSEGEVKEASKDSKSTEVDSVKGGSEVSKEVSESKESKDDTSYDLKIEEGSLIDESVLEEVISLAKEQGLSKEQAQKILDSQSSLVSDYHNKVVNDFNDQVVTWGNQIKADKELGGENLTKNVELAKLAVETFAGKEFLQELDQTGYGNHPKLFKLLVGIGRELKAKDTVHSNNFSNEAKSFADKFYPSTKN